MPDVEKKNVQHFIDGEFVDSADGATFESISPIDNEVVADVALGGAEDVDRAVRAARRAFEEGPWPRMSAAERGAILYKLADLLEANRDEVANWETLDTGKPIMASSTRDIHGTTERFRFFADYAKQSLDHGDHFDNLETNQSTIVVKEPVGVVGAIAPWNLPLPLMGWKLGPALAFGNTVVAKPSEDSPITMSLLAEMFAEAGLPDGVVNVVNGFGPASAGGAIVDHPGVDAITFTGSGTAGRAIMAAAAPTLKKVALELGGKSANIFFADADLSKAVSGSGMAIFGNSGQMCIACSRMFVQRPIYDQVVEMTAAMAEKLPIGDPRDPATVMGPVINTEAVERIQRFIEFSTEDGARLVAGGYKLDGEFAAGNFIKPTVFADATNDMRSCRDEIFGPVQHIIPFDTETEALKMANDCDYGLGGAVWTTDLGKANRVSRSMRTGFVWVNGYARHDDRAPFGGYKQSGIGREGGKYSEEFFTEQKGIEFTY